MTTHDDAALGELKRVDSADVYKHGNLAGTLIRHDDHVEFVYLDEYVASAELPAVATTLPKTRTSTIARANALPPFFAGLLPEGRRLTVLRTAVKTSADDEFSLLLAVGADPVGDVQVVPSGEAPTRNHESVRASEWNEISFTSLLGVDALVDRVGIAGVQDKVSARVISGPVARTNASYILKLNPPEYPYLVENEAFFLRWARTAGLDVVEHEVVHDRDGQPGLLVKRFDRLYRRGRLVDVVACEDACQVLGRVPGDKYKVSLDRLIAVVGATCGAPIVAARNLYTQAVYAYLTGNGDQHAKNFSIVVRDGEWRVSLAYDLPSTTVYDDRRAALSVCGSDVDISRRQWVELAVACGLREAVAQQIIDDLLSQTQPMIDEIADGALPFTQQVVADLVAELRYRRRLLQGN